MTKVQIEQLEEFAFELRNNRDCYSKAKIIEMMVDKVKILNKPDVIGSFCILQEWLDYAKGINISAPIAETEDYLATNDR